MRLLFILLACVCILLPTPAHPKRLSLEKYYAKRDIDRNNCRIRYRSHRRSRVAYIVRGKHEAGDAGHLTDKPPIPYLYATGNAVSDAFTGGYLISDRSCGGGDDVLWLRLHSTVH